MTTKKTAITAAALRRAADSRSYKKGEDYFQRGLVRSLLADADEIVAKVRGTRVYTVRLRMSDADISGECSCPMGDMGAFCKHMVAVGLVQLASGVTAVPGGNAKRPRGAKPPPKPKVTLDDVREHLLQQDPASLVEIIMQQVQEDDRLRESLLMKVARQRPGELDVATFRAAIDAATDSGGFIDYREAYGFATDVDNVVASIAELLDAGHAA